MHRLEAAGFRARVLPAVDVGPELRDELERIARAWRGAAPERGFVMALDALFGRADAESVFVVGLDDEDGELSVRQRLQAATLRRMKGWFQLDNLLLFNRKFFPTWQRRFVVYERRRDLPRVGVATLAAEAYLPFQ